MLSIRCPHCGVDGEETEFAPGGEAHIARAAEGASDEVFSSYMFERKNPRGVHLERWRHAFGCGKWFHLARSTETLESFGAYPADVLEPPQEVLDRIEAAREEGRVR